MVLLEREASAPGVHGYAVLGSNGDLSDPALEQRIDRHAAEGYRLAPRGVVIQRRPEFWLPESEYEDRVVLILHRVPGASAAQRYSWLSYGTPERFAREVTRLRIEGHEVLGMANTGHKLAFLLSRQDEPTELPGP